MFPPLPSPSPPAHPIHLHTARSTAHSTAFDTSVEHEQTAQAYTTTYRTTSSTAFSTAYSTSIQLSIQHSIQHKHLARAYSTAYSSARSTTYRRPWKSVLKHPFDVFRFPGGRCYFVCHHAREAWEAHFERPLLHVSPSRGVDVTLLSMVPGRL